MWYNGLLDPAVTLIIYLGCPCDFHYKLNNSSWLRRLNIGKPIKRAFIVKTCCACMSENCRCTYTGLIAAVSFSLNKRSIKAKSMGAGCQLKWAVKSGILTQGLVFSKIWTSQCFFKEIASAGAFRLANAFSLCICWVCCDGYLSNVDVLIHFNTPVHVQCTFAQIQRSIRNIIIIIFFFANQLCNRYVIENDWMTAQPCFSPQSTVYLQWRMERTTRRMVDQSPPSFSYYCRKAIL